jgi:hypothetical protein
MVTIRVSGRAVLEASRSSSMGPSCLGATFERVFTGPEIDLAAGASLFASASAQSARS